MNDEGITYFQNFILEWYELNKRSFPWRYTFSPYKVFVSEILLQQTNADKVIKPFNQITEAYKSMDELASADITFLNDIFMELGLFYRAQRLIDISKYLMDQHHGVIPNKKEELLKIKGIGDYTCNAILCFGYHERYALVDTNIIRVFERYLNFKSTKKRPHTDKSIWKFAQRILPNTEYIDYNYGLLDFAALVCKAKKPGCTD